MQTQNNFSLNICLFLIIISFSTSCKKSNAIQGDEKSFRGNIYYKISQLNLKEGDLLFQDLDSSPLCDAIEKVTFSINNLNFSHIGIVTIQNKKY